ncbi:MAG: TonB family protein [Saprospiraceae bacterium]|nr:TonB family protein [Saprospiraceae bacterium]
MLTYILEVSLCWAAFYVLYAVLLSRETFFHFNRWYLMSTFVLSFIIPKAEWQLPQPVADSDIAVVYFQPITVGMESLEVTVTATALTPSIGVMDVLRWLYWIGVAFFAFRFLVGFIQIIRFYHKSERQRRNGYELVLSEKTHAPFSFFNRLFLSKKMELNPEDQQNILRHELAHIRGGHSIDVLLLELAGILFWCSPFVYMYRRSLRNVHEYIADAEVLLTTKKKQYGHLLIRQSQSGHSIAIANHFHSQLKKRILMMMRNQSKRRAMLKYLLVIPLTLTVMLVFSNANAKASFQEQAVSLEQAIEKQLDQNVEKRTVATISSNNFTRLELTHDGKLLFNAGDLEISIDTVPVHISEKKATFDPVNFEIHYRDGNVVKFTKGAGEQWDQDIKPEDIESIEVIKKDGDNRIKIYMKGNSARNIELTNKYIASDVRTVLVNALQDDIKAWRTDLDVNSVEFQASFSLRTLQATYRKVVELYPDRQNDITKMAKELASTKAIDLDIKNENLFLFQTVVNGVPISSKLSSAVSYAANEVDEMPIFAGCEGIADAEERRKCSERSLLTFIYKNIKYPKEAREKGIQGTVYVQYYIDEKGLVTGVTIGRGIGGGCDEEVIRVVNSMPRWTPAYKKGKPVNTYQALPVNYKLDGDERTASFLQDNELRDTIITFNLDKNDKRKEEIEVQDWNSRKITVVGYGEQKVSPEKAKSGKDGALLEEMVVVGYPSDQKNVSNEEIFKIVEEMPLFPGCDEQGTYEEKKPCADRKMLEYIYKNIKYPKEARDAGVEGMVVVSFVVEKDGSISTPRIMRDIGAGCGEEALRLIHLMQERVHWTPGKQRGRNVRVQFNLPIRFKLEDKSTEKVEEAAQPKIDLPANTLQLESFKVSPNPTNGSLNLYFKGEKKPTDVTIFDMSGKGIFSFQLKNFNGEYSDTFDLSEFNKGVLILQIRQGEKVFSEKIVLQ